MSPPRTVTEALDHAARCRPDSPYLSLDDGELTFAGLRDRAAAGAACLHRRGLSAGDRVAIVGGNELAVAVALFACARAGYVAVPVNPAHEGPMLAYLLSDCEPAAVICAGDAARPELTTAGVPVLTTAEFWAEAAPGPDHAHPTAAVDPISIMYTSGTTGRSKGAVLPNGLYVKQAESYLTVVGRVPDDVFFTSLPLFHTNAQCLTLMGSLLALAPCRIVGRFSASRFVAQCVAAGATVTNLLGAMVPMLLTRMAQPAGPNPLRVVVGGGAAATLTQELERRLDVRFRQIYGLTEVGICAGEHADTADGTTAGSIVDGFAVRIAADGRSAGAPASTTVGEIQVRPDRPEHLFREYWNNPAATRAAYTADGWFRTGDLGTFDGRDRLVFHGRTKEVIRRRGENVACADVEAVVLTSPAVRDCAAIAVASELAEDEIKLCYVPADDASITDVIIEFCRENLPGFMIPRYFEQVTAIPRTSTFKVERHLLGSTDPSTVMDTND